VSSGVHQQPAEKQGEDGVHIKGKAADIGGDRRDAGDSGGGQSLPDHADLVSDPVGDKEGGGGSAGGVQHVSEFFRGDPVFLADIAEYVSVYRRHQAVVDGAAHSQSPGAQADGTSLFKPALGGVGEGETAAQTPDK